MDSIRLCTVIIDDDQRQLEIISSAFIDLISGYPIDLDLHSYVSVEEANDRFFSQGKITDLILLDIGMPGTDGVALAKRIRKNNVSGDLIFISSNEERVYETLQVQPYGFVRKSHFDTEFPSVIKSYLNRFVSSGEKNLLVFKTEFGEARVDANKIMYVEGDRKNQLIYVENRKDPITTSLSMQEIEDMLPSDAFLRIHKSYLVNCAYISSMSDEYAVLTDGCRVKMAKRKVSEIKTEYLDYLSKHDTLII